MSDALDNWIKAVEREQLIRNAAFLPASESIGPFEAVPFTLQHYIALRVIKSPFVIGGTPTEADAAVFLWQVSPDYSADNSGKRNHLKLCRWFAQPMAPFFRTSRRMKNYLTVCDLRLRRFVEIIRAIQEYLAESEMDWPATSGERGPAYWSDAANLCATFGAAYGWTVQETMGTPLKVLFQLLKIIDAKDKSQANKIPVMFNPSDRERAQWLEEETRRDNGDN